MDALPVGAFWSATFFSHNVWVEDEKTLRNALQLPNEFCNRNSHKIQVINISELHNPTTARFTSIVYYRKVAENGSGSAMQNKQQFMSVQSIGNNQ